jgi:hypothetical protein
MPLLASMAFPDANAVLINMLRDIAPTVLRPPAEFVPPLIQVKRVGGQSDPEDVTDFPIMLISCYGRNWGEAQDLLSKVQVRILTSPLTEVPVLDPQGNVTGRVLVDSAAIHVGEVELPGEWPDDRRLNATFQLGWRRQFPVS